MTLVTHPTKFTISGMTFQVSALVALTDQQAAKIAMRFYQTRKFKKQDQGKFFLVQTVFDQDSIALL